MIILKMNGIWLFLTKNRSKIGKYWLKNNTLDYWRHSRMREKS